MQISISGDQEFYCYLVLVPGALEANKATRKKQSLERSNIKSMKAPGKTLGKTRKLEETFIQKSQANLRLESINVRILVGKSAEVTETVGRRLDIAGLQEVCYGNEGLKY